MFFYVSLVLVIVAAITLVIGLLSSGLPLVIVSIASSFFAGVFLVLTVLRDRPRADEEAKTPTVAPAVSRDEPDEDFPIAEYDDLKVGEIVPLLSELDDDELDVVRAREEAGRGRATILGRIDELLSEGEAEGAEAAEPDQDAGFPIADYDELKVGEIVPLLPELDDDELDAVRDREVAGRARASIVGRIDELLGDAPAPAPATKAAAPAKTPSAAKSPAKKAPAKKAAAKKAPAKKTAAKKTPAKKSAAAKKSAGTAKKSAGTAKKSAPRARR